MGLVMAALLLQFSIGAVDAWSVFSSALKSPDARGTDRRLHLCLRVRPRLVRPLTQGGIFTEKCSLARNMF